MDGITLPCIDANPDIAGIGVRISVYIQTILLTISATTFLSDGSISPYESKALASASATLLITGCALLICSFVQAATIRFSVYHALVVLNLSRITNMGGYLYILAHFASSNDRYKFWPAAVLPTLHLSAMGGFGIWVWEKIDQFGSQPRCTPLTFLTLFGRNLPVIGSARDGSQVFYYMMAIPGFNFLVVAIFMQITSAILHLFVACFLGGVERIFLCSRGGVPTILSESKKETTSLFFNAAIISTGVEVLSIIDTELMISRSASLVKSGESEWSFGQTLAMVMVIFPLMETVKSVYQSLARRTQGPESSMNGVGGNENKPSSHVERTFKDATTQCEV